MAGTVDHLLPEHHSPSMDSRSGLSVIDNHRIIYSNLEEVSAQSVDSAAI